MNRDRGQREYEALIGSRPEDSLAELRSRSPHIYEAVVAGAFGGPLSRPELGRINRQFATVAILSSIGGAEPQLAVHVRAALHVGITPAELLALCEHVSVYAGMPRAINALAVVDQVLVEAGIPRPARPLPLRLSDHETAVVRRGDHGPAVVLLHALGLDWRMWEAVMDRLGESRRTFAYDIRGHGEASEAPTSFTMADAARDLAQVLDGVDVDRAHIVGLSYGGGIAQTFAVNYPERCESLSLLATTDYPFDSFEDRAHAAETEGMSAQVAPSLTRWFTSGALAMNGSGVTYARERVLRARPANWAAAWRAFSTLDVQGKLAAFQPPVLVVTGEHDASTTPEIMAGIADRIPGATYRELPGTPHMQTLEQPELVAETLDQFLPTT